MKDYKAIAFDIDGTLYPSWVFNFCVAPYFLIHLPFFLKYAKVRHILHRTAPLADFFEYQGRLLAHELGCSVAEAEEKICRLIYTGLKPFFRFVRPFPQVKETFRKFHEAGYKIALLSDFPPEQKGNLWGIRPYCDEILGTEQIGALKPSVYPFGVLAMKLGVKPSEILYVGNSVRYDIEGAHNAGMKTAYLLPFWRRLFCMTATPADISFKSYRHLQNIVLQ
jgi:putative hydrolase of the HAD superfamily